MPAGIVVHINLWTLQSKNFASLVEVKDSSSLDKPKSFEFTITIIGKPSTLDLIWKGEDKSMKSISTEKSKLDTFGRREYIVYNRLGNYFCLFYSHNNQLRKLSHIEQQQNAANKIETMLERSVYNGFARNLRILITGPKGTGKSEMAYILADRMDACICMDFKPTDPGDNIQNLINHTNPSKDKLLIILINEWDEVVEKINDNIIQRNRHIPSSIFDKSSYNNFMDTLGNI